MISNLHFIGTFIRSWFLVHRIRNLLVSYPVISISITPCGITIPWCRWHPQFMSLTIASVSFFRPYATFLLILFIYHYEVGSFRMLHPCSCISSPSISSFSVGEVRWSFGGQEQNARWTQANSCLAKPWLDQLGDKASLTKIPVNKVPSGSELHTIHWLRCMGHRFYDFIKEFNCKYNNHFTGYRNRQFLVIIHITTCCMLLIPASAPFIIILISGFLAYGNNQGNNAAAAAGCEVYGRGNVAIRGSRCCCGRSS